MNDKNIRYKAVIVGGGHKLKKNKRFAQTLGLSNITFTGYADDTQPFFKKAYCFILPSLEEGSGSIAVLEAMAAGLPIIASDIDGIPEDVVGGVSGILVAPANPQALAAAIEKLLKNRRLAQRFGRKAKIKFREKYSSGRVRSALKKFLHLSVLPDNTE